jgi:outer membrane protein
LGAPGSDDIAADQNPENQTSDQSDRGAKKEKIEKTLSSLLDSRKGFEQTESAGGNSSAVSARAAGSAQTILGKIVELRKIVVKEKEGGTTATVTLSSPVQFFSFYRKSPPSVFVQFLGGGALASGGPVENVAIGSIDQVAYGYETSAPPGPGKKAILRYLEFRLNKPVVHYAEQNGDQIILTLSEVGQGGIVQESSLFETDKYTGPLNVPDNPTLDDFLRVAQTNNKSLALAREGDQLAKYQVLEAERPLFPSATLKASQTTGDDASPLPNGVTGEFPTTGFQQEEYGVQLGQPIYQSGKVWAAYQRSKLNKKVAEESVHKQVSDINFEVQKAYFELLKNQAVLRVRQELLAQATQIRDMTQNKKALKLTSQIDALNVDSQFAQISYQVASCEQEVALARLNLAATLNQSRELSDPVPGGLEARHVKVDLDTLLKWAAANRADLRIAKMNVDLGEKSWKIAKGEDGFRVDMSGFIGKSGAAFSDETLNVTTAWNVGVKASVPFWGNTLSANRTDEQTAPDLSQSFVTAVHSNSVTLGILDSMSGVSKSEQARLNYEKAKADYTEALQKAEYEVREAYFNLAKISHQLESAQSDVEFHRREVAVTREKNSLGLVENSQLVTDEVSYAQAQISYQEAMAASETGMATLEKAIGVKLGR